MTATWSELRAALPDGLCEEAVEAIRAATAPARAAERTRLAILASVGAVGGDPDPVCAALYALRYYDHLTPEERAERVAPVRAVMRAAGALCIVEATAGGGKYGLGMAPTARALWARCLGKGRRQASDGDAWTAAIAAAGADLLMASDGHSGAPTPDMIAAIPSGVDDEGVRGYARHAIWHLAQRAADHAAAAPQYLAWSSILARWADPPPTLRELAAEGRLTIAAIVSQED